MTRIVLRVKKLHMELFKACMESNLARVRELLEPDVNLAELWTVEDYPLTMAIWNNQIEIVKLLLDRGMPAYMNTRDALEQYGAVEDLWLTGLWRPEPHEAIIYLLDRGCPAFSKEFSFMPVTQLVMLEESDIDNRADEFFERLMGLGIDVDIPIDTSNTLLHFIAKQHNKYVPMLIKLSKNIDAGDPAIIISTPLRSAVQKVSEVAVNALLKAGANPNLVFKYAAESMLDLSYRTKTEREYLNAKGQVDRIIAALLEHGALTYNQIIERDLSSSGRGASK